MLLGILALIAGILMTPVFWLNPTRQGFGTSVAGGGLAAVYLLFALLTFGLGFFNVELLRRIYFSRLNKTILFLVCIPLMFIITDINLMAAYTIIENLSQIDDYYRCKVGLLTQLSVASLRGNYTFMVM